MKCLINEDGKTGRPETSVTKNLCTLRNIP